MSIYATLWILKFPAHGDEYSDCEWETVMAQGVPGHIGTPTEGHGYESCDPYAGFLPPAIPMPMTRMIWVSVQSSLSERAPRR